MRYHENEVNNIPHLSKYMTRFVASIFIKKGMLSHKHERRVMCKETIVIQQFQRKWKSGYCGLIWKYFKKQQLDFHYHNLHTLTHIYTIHHFWTSGSEYEYFVMTYGHENIHSTSSQLLHQKDYAWSRNILTLTLQR